MGSRLTTKMEVLLKVRKVVIVNGYFSCAPSLAMGSWKTHKPTWHYVAPPGKDFIALNKASILSGLTNAQEQQHYRATHDIRKKQKLPDEKEELKIPEGMVFGISTRYNYSN